MKKVCLKCRYWKYGRCVIPKEKRFKRCKEGGHEKNQADGNQASGKARQD